jgi:hypothetical protein
MEANEKRIVVVVNKTIDIGPAMNAVAHASLGFGASRDPHIRAELKLLDYVDGAGGVHPHISARSLIVLRARPIQLQKLRDQAIAANLPCVSFTNTMTQGTFRDQLERTQATDPDQLVYYAVLLFGTRDELDPLTRKFSLFGGPLGHIEDNSPVARLEQ